jgi:hypothetical protein
MRTIRCKRMARTGRPCLNRVSHVGDACWRHGGPKASTTKETWTVDERLALHGAQIFAGCPQDIERLLTAAFNGEPAADVAGCAHLLAALAVDPEHRMFDDIRELVWNILSASRRFKRSL